MPAPDPEAILEDAVTPSAGICTKDDLVRELQEEVRRLHHRHVQTSRLLNEEASRLGLHSREGRAIRNVVAMLGGME